MEAKNIRIGNLVDLYSSLATIQMADLKGIGIAVDKGKPIELTEDWIGAFGFKKNGKYFIKSHFDIDYCFLYADFRKNWSFYVEYTDSPDPKDQGEKYPVSFETKYVHQLQNLFFALTNTELKLERRPSIGG